MQLKPQGAKKRVSRAARASSASRAAAPVPIPETNAEPTPKRRDDEWMRP
jgi:hypothetical protein